MIKHLILVSFILLSTAGCSFLPRISFDKGGVVPEQVFKVKNIVKCAGELTIDDRTGIVSCTKGFYKYGDEKQITERKYTFAEKIGNFISNLAGWGFWILVLALIFVPGLGGWLIGRIFNIFRTSLTSTVKAIGQFKSEIPMIVVNGEEVPDPTYIKVVDSLLDQLEIEHSKSPNILKTISDIRLKLKVEDND